MASYRILNKIIEVCEAVLPLQRESLLDLNKMKSWKQLETRTSYHNSQIASVSHACLTGIPHDQNGWGNSWFVCKFARVCPTGRILLVGIRRGKNEQVTRNSCVFQRPHPMWYAGQALRLRDKISSQRQRVKLPKVPSDNSPLNHVPGVSGSLVSVSYTCKECQKSFDGQASLQRHLYNCHQASDMMPYQCEQCKKGFLHKSSYIRHLKQHEGIFNFTCQVCGKGFYNKSDLKGHLVSHGGHQEFTCVYCGRKFAYKQGLHQHIKAAHQD